MVKPIRTVVVVPSLPPELERLRDLAYNLRWSWDHETIDLFRRLDRDLWETSGHNPVKMLGSIQQERLDEAAANPGFLAQLARQARRLDDYIAARSSAWYASHHGDRPDMTVAYFSAEFGLTDSIPIYSGGLGVLAGDHLKSASDMGVPLVGVGLAYQKGYFRQYLNADGWQAESYPVNDFYTMPMQLERHEDGTPITIEVPFPGRSVKAQIWRIQVGRVPLYLLDTNISVNSPGDQDITDQLYGGDMEMRIKQEMVLGIGGVRALQALGIKITVCHMNEGHAAFSGLERIRTIIERHDVPFDVARLVAMNCGIFTTHTPVPAGIDKFGVDLIDRYLSPYYEWLRISREEFLGLGRVDPNNWQEPFNMAILALKLSGRRNGVSELHGEVSRAMWRSLYPKVPEQEIPIAHITNGMHTASMLSVDMTELYDRYMGPEWRENQIGASYWPAMEHVPAEEVWRTHERRRQRLVAVARQRLRRQLERHGAPQREIEAAAEALNPSALTIGFARRFATYKRATLLLRDPDRLERLLSDRDRPVQIIFAGKAHPADNPGKDLIRQLVHASRQPRFRGRLVFLEDYDLNLARYLVAGADVWLNTPRRPREASGTSGMKAAANGALNVSVLDGWWAEAYDPEIGWAIGSGEVYDDPDYQDKVESDALYNLLEKEIIPLFYEREVDGLPRGWIDRMRRSIARLTPVYNTNRMVKEYTDSLYLPADREHERVAQDNLSSAVELAEWLKPMYRLWNQIWVRDVRSSRDSDQVPVRDKVDIDAEVFLGEIEPEDVRVELYFGRLHPDRGIMEPMTVTMQHVESKGAGIQLYRGTFVTGTSGRFGYTVRVLPTHANLPEPMMPGLISWA